MTVWVLVFYMSIGFGSGATGGPATIDGFTSQARCEESLLAVSRLPKYDFGYCLAVTK